MSGFKVGDRVTVKRGVTGTPYGLQGLAGEVSEGVADSARRGGKFMVRLDNPPTDDFGGTRWFYADELEAASKHVPEPARPFVVGDEVTSVEYPVHGVGRVTEVFKHLLHGVRVEFSNGVYMWAATDQLKRVLRPTPKAPFEVLDRVVSKYYGVGKVMELRYEDNSWQARVAFNDTISWFDTGFLKKVTGPEVSYIVVKVGKQDVAAVRRVLHELTRVQSDMVFPSAVQRPGDSEKIADIYEQSMARGKRMSKRPWVRKTDMGDYVIVHKNSAGETVMVGSAWYPDRARANTALDLMFPKQDYL